MVTFSWTPSPPPFKWSRLGTFLLRTPKLGACYHQAWFEGARCVLSLNSFHVDKDFYNPSQNILRPTPNGLIFCSFLWKHICSLRKGNNIYAPPPTKQCCFQMIIFTPKSPPITPTILVCQGKGQKIDAVSEFL